TISPRRSAFRARRSACGSRARSAFPAPSPCCCGCWSPPSAVFTDREMLALDDQQQAARDWFESLRDRICSAFEEIEREAGSDAAFAYTPWDRTDTGAEPGGGGVRALMTGKLFEK